MGPILSTERPGNDEGVIDDDRVDVEDDDDDNIQSDEPYGDGTNFVKKGDLMICVNQLTIS